MRSGLAEHGSSRSSADEVEYLRRALADVLRFGVKRVAIGEQGGGVVLRVRFASDASVEKHLDMVVQELEDQAAVGHGESHVLTDRHLAVDGEVVTVIRTRAERLYGFVAHADPNGEILVTGMPLVDAD